MVGRGLIIAYGRLGGGGAREASSKLAFASLEQGGRRPAVIPTAGRNLKSMTTRADGRYYVYIMTNSRRTLYVGVTNDIERRVYEHKHKWTALPRGTTTWLVHYEETSDVVAAIEREKQVKGWRRSKKVALIESVNPHLDSRLRGNDGMRF